VTYLQHIIKNVAIIEFASRMQQLFVIFVHHS